MNKPLQNKTIVITRGVEQSESSLNIFGNLGANVILFPTIKIINPVSFELFDEAVKNFNNFNYLIFTSVNSVNKFSERISDLNILLDFTNIKVVATGSRTAKACLENNIKVDLIPVKYNAENIIDNLKDEIKNKNVLVPCSAIAREELVSGLTSAGANVVKTVIYEVGIPDKDEIAEYISELNRNSPDVFIFTSPSTFKNFLSILKIDNPEIYFRNTVIAAIGTTTESAIESFNVNVNIVPEVFTIEALAESVTDYFEKINFTNQHG